MSRYYTEFAAAYVRGRLNKLDRPFEELTESDYDSLFELGTQSGLRMHKFKRTMGLERVRKVLGMLKGLQPVDLLDIGTGRGVFLWPLLELFPSLPVTCIDTLPHRVADLQALAKGGITRVHAMQMDAQQLGFEDNSFDGVTLLETLEHIPNPLHVIRESCRVARQFVIVSVPAKPDNNPEHIHLFTTQTLNELFEQAGINNVRFDGVLNHIIALALKDL